MELHVSNCKRTWMSCRHETVSAIRAASRVSAHFLLLDSCGRTTTSSADFFAF